MDQTPLATHLHLAHAFTRTRTRTCTRTKASGGLDRGTWRHASLERPPSGPALACLGRRPAARPTERAAEAALELHDLLLALEAHSPDLRVPHVRDTVEEDDEHLRPDLRELEEADQHAHVPAEPARRRWYGDSEIRIERVPAVLAWYCRIYHVPAFWRCVWACLEVM